MAYFDAAADAFLRGQTVTGSLLAFFDFADTPMRVHAGHGPLAAGGFTWAGLGGLGSVSPIESAVGGIAPVVTFTLVGTDPAILDDVRNAATRVKNRVCEVSLQFFDSDTLAPLGSPYKVYAGKMDRLTHKAPSADQWTAQLTAETLFDRRGLPPYGNLTDRDQQARYPGDTGLAQIPAMQNRRRPWNPVLPS